MYKIYETKTFTSLSQQRHQQKGEAKLKWRGDCKNLGDFETTANHITRKICSLTNEIADIL